MCAVNRRLLATATVALTLLAAACSSEANTAASVTVVSSDAAGTTMPSTETDPTAADSTVPDTSTPDTSIPDTTMVDTTSPAGPVTIKPAVAPIGEHLAAAITTPDGRVRTYELYVPTTLPEGPVPLVVALHGGTGWGKQFERNSGLDGLAEANGFLVVFPDGVGAGPTESDRRTWNAGYCCGAAARENVDDVAFIDQLLDTIGAEYDVDPSRTFATGHSNGGMLSYRLACELSDRFAAVALQAGSLGVEPCEPELPVSLLHIHGTADTNHPIDGGFGDGLANVDFRSANESVTLVARADGCEGNAIVAVDAVNLDLMATFWNDCDAGAVVELVTVAGASHAWMGHTPSNPAATPAYMELDASVTVLQFLFEHPRAA